MYVILLNNDSSTIDLFQPCMILDTIMNNINFVISKPLLSVTRIRTWVNIFDCKGSGCMTFGYLLIFYLDFTVHHLLVS